MGIICTHTLHPSQKTGIQSLLTACWEKDSPDFSFPFEEAGLFVFFIDRDTILSAAAFTELDENTWECAAFTHPSYRKQGLFSALLEEGISVLPPETDLLFYVNAKNPAALSVMEALGAELDSVEYMMEFTFPTTWESPSLPTTDLAVSETTQDEEPVLFYQGAHGGVRIALWENHYYLYDFEIAADFRGLGHGKKLLRLVMDDLHRRDPKPIRLQVSKENRPALALYKKTGFRIIETLSCYLY